MLLSTLYKQMIPERKEKHTLHGNLTARLIFLMSRLQLSIFVAGYIIKIYEFNIFMGWIIREDWD